MSEVTRVWKIEIGDPYLEKKGQLFMHPTHYRRPAFLSCTASDLQNSDNIMITKWHKRFSLYLYAPFGIVNEMDRRMDEWKEGRTSNRRLFGKSFEKRQARVV